MSYEDKAVAGRGLYFQCQESFSTDQEEEMSIRSFPKEMQSYILQWCLKEEKCPLTNVCSELVTGNCAVVRFLSDLDDEADMLTINRMKLMDN